MNNILTDIVQKNFEGWVVHHSEQLHTEVFVLKQSIYIIILINLHTF